MQVWNVLHTACWKYRTQKWCKKSPSAHHRTTLSGYIFATKARIDNWKKNLLSSSISPTCPYNMVNFGLLVTEIVSLVWGTKLIPIWFRVLAALLHSHTAALNRRRHLYSAGRPSRWALAHISSCLSSDAEQTSVISCHRRMTMLGITRLGQSISRWLRVRGAAVRPVSICRRYYVTADGPNELELSKQTDAMHD